MQYTYQTKRYLVRVRRVLNYWPWFVSAVAHLVVLAILSAVVFISFDTDRDARKIVPEARLGRIIPQLPVFNPAVRNAPVMPEKLLQKQFEQQISPKTPEMASQKELDIIGLGPGNRADHHAVDLGRVAAVAPRTHFFNACGNAYSVVYVVDVSRSMRLFVEPLKRELKRCLNDLKPMQKFHVIFFSSGKPIEGPAGGLTWASDRNKRRYYEFIANVQTGRKTDPRWAVKRAIELEPDLIYLLTDGEFSSKHAEQIIQWSKSRKIKINTIAYVNEQGAVLLRRIAEHTGGIYRFVSEGQLLWE